MTAIRTRFDKRYSLPGIDTTSVDSIAENMRESYAGIGQAASDFSEKFSALKAQERKAKSLVPDADITSDPSVNSVFADRAQLITDKINGDVEGSYNFLSANDLQRFNEDIAQLQKDMDAFEPTYAKAVEGLQSLVDEHDRFMKVGGDPRQAVTETINGVDFYNKKASTLEFEETIKMADAIRFGDIERNRDTGELTVLDQNGNSVAEFGSEQELLAEIVALSKPDLQPVPVTDGKTLVEEKRWGSYDTEAKAESAFLNYVLNNPALAERRRREKLGLTGPEPEGAETSEEVQALLDKHPKTSEGFDNMSQAQYDYVQEMKQGWRDLQEVKEPKSTSASSSSKKLDGLVGQIGGAELTINTGLGDLEESVGGTSGLVVKGKVGLDGGKEGSLKKIIYNPNSQEAGGSGFSVVIFDGEKDVVMPFDPKPGDQAKDAIAAALGLSQEDMIKLLREIKNKGE